MGSVRKSRSKPELTMTTADRRQETADRQQHSEEQLAAWREREFLFGVVDAQIKATCLLCRDFVVIACFKYRRVAISVVVAFIYSHVCRETPSWHHRHKRTHTYTHSHITVYGSMLTQSSSVCRLLRHTRCLQRRKQQLQQRLCCICCTNTNVKALYAMCAIHLEIRLYVYFYLCLCFCEILPLSFIVARRQSCCSA